MHARTLLACGALLLVPAAARAGDEPEGAAALAPAALRSFDSFDKDKDGKVSKAEFPYADAFDAFDTDGDGFLTREELRAVVARIEKERKDKDPAGAGKVPGDAKGPPGKKPGMDARRDPEARAREMLANFDRDKDGKIARAEYPGDEGDGVFRKFDRNKDGFLAEGEVLSLAKDQIEDLRKARLRPKRSEFLYLFDDDGDRRVTKEEYDGPAKYFAQYDLNGDGVVTYEELYYPNRSKADRRDDPASNAAENLSVWTLYDKDKDGRVTKEEWGGSEAVFRRLDRNGDGVLSSLDA